MPRSSSCMDALTQMNGKSHPRHPTHIGFLKLQTYRGFNNIYKETWRLEDWQQLRTNSLRMIVPPFPPLLPAKMAVVIFSRRERPRRRCRGALRACCWTDPIPPGQ